MQRRQKAAYTVVERVDWEKEIVAACGKDKLGLDEPSGHGTSSL